MTRLPLPGSDDGVWGNLLNEYLSVEHNADGTLKKAADIAAAQAAADAAVKTVNSISPDGNGNVALTKADVGLGNVDNTSDANKPISTATQTALDTKLDAAYELRGTGFPEGVVTANPGTYYTDMASTSGAIRWVKIAGNGNTGWRVIIGDTYWRDITSSLNPAALDPSNAGQLAIRRMNDKVVWRFTDLLLAPGSGPLGLTNQMPQSFWPAAITTGQIMRHWDSTYIEELTFNVTDIYWIGELQFTTGTFTQTHPAVGIEGMWSSVTDTSWPSSLPGTPTA